MPPRLVKKALVIDKADDSASGRYCTALIHAQFPKAPHNPLPAWIGKIIVLKKLMRRLR